MTEPGASDGGAASVAEQAVPALPPMPDIILINLDRSPERLAFQTRQFERLGLAFERITAVDGAALSNEAYRRSAFLWERPLSRSEVGCLLSHIACWKRVAASGHNTLIVEDDVVLAPEIVAVLAGAGALSGPVAVNLEARKGLRYLSGAPVTLPGLSGCTAFDLMLGTAGSGAYILTPDAAARLLAESDRRGPIADIYIWTSPSIRQLQLDPGLALPIDKLRGRFGKHIEKSTPGATTITKPRLNIVMSVLQLFRHPRLRLRRAAGQFRLAAAKLRLSGHAVRRAVSPLPSIHTSYQAMKGVRNG
jgi:glycosyl transferase family 25